MKKNSKVVITLATTITPSHFTFHSFIHGVITAKQAEMIGRGQHANIQHTAAQ